jgi:hypothetical protein
MKAIAARELLLVIILVVVVSIAAMIGPATGTQAEGPAPQSLSGDPSLGGPDLANQGLPASRSDAQRIAAADDVLERFFRVNGESTVGSSVFPLADGFLVFAGHGEHLNATKLDLSGNVAFSKDLNCGANGWFKSIVATADGGYLLGGLINTSPQYGFVLKLGSDLTPQWSKRFDSFGEHVWVDGARPTADGGSIVLVRDVEGFGIVKLDASRNVEWQKRVYLGSAGNQTSVYDIYENTYLDGSSQLHCGGIVFFGAVQNTTADSDWDLVLAALSCDGNTILWQRRIGGASWEGSYTIGTTVYDRAGGIVVVDDHNGTNTQDADLLVVATGESFGTQRSDLFVPFHISGTVTLSTTVAIGSSRDLDSAGNDSIDGNFGGPCLIRLADGNLLLVGHTDFPGSVLGLFLVKMQPDLDLLWQALYGTYDTLNSSGVSESAAGLQVVGGRFDLPGGAAAVFMQVSPDGDNSGEYLIRETGEFTMTTVSPAITTPSFTLDGGTLQVADQTCTAEDTTAWLIHPSRAHLPIVLKDS